MQVYDKYLDSPNFVEINFNGNGLVWQASNTWEGELRDAQEIYTKLGAYLKFKNVLPKVD